jgi:hypothetical protein
MRFDTSIRGALYCGADSEQIAPFYFWICRAYFDGMIFGCSVFFFLWGGEGEGVVDFGGGGMIPICV